MSIFTYHLAKTSYLKALKVLLFPPQPIHTPGLIHMECMTFMRLGSRVISPSRFLNRKIIIFAQWESESAIDSYLEKDSFGKVLSKGWHTRLSYLRQWGKLDEFMIPEESKELDDPNSPVVAVTLARMKLFQVPRFIHWGRPVEKLVRDHPGNTLALASIRLPRTVSTFSVWKSQKEMTDMVFGHSAGADPKRHLKAMKERDRKDFHYQFTTLRFKPIAEYGEWDGRKHIIPNLTKTK
ncbi:hypothetical protein RBU60_10800 [Mesonia sp. MT50]|uniref:Spheroidene monooxygenase n=1 Tax=Mesonia profundi TaxID=3070998 RepID=A0ABU1A472_9FLAO|nr:hypothetical protein [Mesonia profundi]MDQ7918066.1 hypothetical protein [Mesonia profundi]